MKRSHVVFFAVLLLAALLRLYRIDMLDLRFDEASGLQNARNAAGGALLLTAPFSGSVVEHPAIYAYTMALPYLVLHQFWFVAVFRILLDVAAIGMLWLLCARAFDVRTATIAALCFAVAPWAVQFARKMWLAPLPIYHTLLLWGLIELVRWKRPRGWAITGWGLALSVGTHLSAAFLAPVVVAAAWIGRRSFRWKHALLGALPLLVVAAAWLAHAAAGDFEEVRAALAGDGSAPGRRDPLAAVMFAAQAAGGWNLGSLTSGAFAQWQAQLPPWSSAIDVLHLALLGAGVVLLLARALRAGPQRATAFVLVAWCAAVMGAQAMSTRPLQPHYLLPLLPIPFVAIGLLGSTSVMLRRIVMAALVIIVPWQIWTTLRFADFVAVHDTSNGGYGPPVRAAWAMADVARARIQRGEAADVIVVAPGGDPAVDEQAAIMDVLLSDVPRRFVRAEDGMLVRGDATQYVFTPGADDALRRLREIEPSAQWEVRRASVYDGDARVYTSMSGSALQLGNFTAQEATWEGGARLIGHRVQRSDAQLVVDAFVSVVGIPATDVHWFARAIDGERQIASVDIGGVRPTAWRVGDVLVLRFQLALPAADAAVTRVRLGAYAYPEIRQLAVLDAMGNPIDDGVDVVVR